MPCSYRNYANEGKEGITKKYMTYYLSMNRGGLVERSPCSTFFVLIPVSLRNNVGRRAAYCFRLGEHLEL